MAAGYLTTVVLATVITVFCLVPVRGPAPLFWFSYRLGLVFNELPFLALYGLAAATALAFAEGDITTAADWAAVALAVVPAVGLAVVARRGLRTAAVVKGPWTRRSAPARPPGTGRRWPASCSGRSSAAAARSGGWRTSATATRASATCWTSTTTAPAPRAARC
ncbi:hypothetical protein ACFQ2M_20670 [Kitasatospora saccharophila]|uniref:hypothetical protein n=1 Tax=Kitasatospora saccharophila TaxID=407973 RepID=UPI0036393D5B